MATESNATYLKRYEIAVNNLARHQKDLDAQSVATFREGIRRGHMAALVNLGVMYMDHRVENAEPNWSDREAINHFKLAADLGNINAFFNLGLIYQRGLSGIDKSITNAEAIEWYGKAAEKGDLEAMRKLGWLLIHAAKPMEQPQSIQRGVHWLRIAAERGDIDAMVILGINNRKDRKEGSPPKISDEEALRWFALAADLGDSCAMANLGLLYAKGEVPGVDTTQAVATGFKYLKEAADRCLEEAKLQLSLIKNGTPAALAAAQANVETVKRFKDAVDNGTVAQTYFFADNRGLL